MAWGIIASSWGQHKKKIVSFVFFFLKPRFFQTSVYIETSNRDYAVTS